MHKTLVSRLPLGGWDLSPLTLAKSLVQDPSKNLAVGRVILFQDADWTLGFGVMLGSNVRASKCHCLLKFEAFMYDSESAPTHHGSLQSHR